MKALAPNYYVLDKSEKDSWLTYLKRPFALLNWALFYFIKRSLINVAVGANEVKFQNAVHVMFTTDDRNERGTVIVNLLPPKSAKRQKNYFDQSPLAKKKNQQLSFHNPKHKAYIDTMINEIGCLLEGKSELDKCVGKKFPIEDFHIKGLERLDAELTHYFQEQICQKYHSNFFTKQRSIKLDFYTLETGDGARLESVKVSNAPETMKPMSERKFLIACMARNQNYMFWLKDFYTAAQKIGCTVIGFNYRGIDYSKGRAWNEKDIVNDALAQAQHLMELGAKPENIAFEGTSFGAAVATIAAAKMHDQGFKVKLYNERSYRSLFRLMVGYMFPAANSNPWNPLNWAKYIIVGGCYVFLGPLIWLQSWELNAAYAWDRIPFEYKTYSVARNHQDPEHFDDDDFVHDSYTSIASLIDGHIQEAKQKQQQGKALSTDEQLLLADKAQLHQFTLDRSIKINPNPSSHSAPRRFLFDSQTHSITMQDYMIECMRQKLSVTA